MTDYVKAYQALERRAADEETKAEAYRRRADDDRWEQCRIAHEATYEGGFSIRRFAEAVGTSTTNVARQRKVWAEFGVPVTGTRPTYAEAIAWTLGSTAKAESNRKQLSNAKSIINDDELLSELLSDPKVVDALYRALAKTAREPRGLLQGDRNRPSSPEDWTADQWDAFDRKVSASAETILDAVLFRKNGWYIPSVEAIASLNLVRKEDLDAELAALVEG